jgi:hypothetical protein
MTELSGNNDASIAGSQAEQEAEANTVILAAAALSKLYTKSLHCIRTRPYQALAPLVLVDGSDVEEDKNMGICGVCAFHPETLEKILADKEVEVDELFLLKMLQRWHNYHTQLLMGREQKQKQKKPKSVHKITNIMQQMTSQTNADAQEQKMLTAVQREKLSDNEFPLFQANFDEMTFASTAFGNSTISTAFSEVAPSWKPFSTAEDNAQDEVPYQFLPSHASTCAFSEQTSNKQQQEEQDTDGQYVCPNPSQVCRKLLPYIDLVAIDPVPLKKIVSQCASFIDQSQVMDALWEQVAIASTLGPTRICFSSIVRGTGDHRNGFQQQQQGANSNSSIRGMLADLATDSMDSSSIPNHQYYKSHILVQGAGVEDCNGIYTQVVQLPRNTRERIMNEPDGDQCDEGQKQEIDELTKLSVASGVSPPSYCIGDDRYDRDEEETTTNMTANTAGTNTTSVANASTGICLRFVKQNNQKRGKGKNKTFYIVCRREPMPVTLYTEKSKKISHQKTCSASPNFLHCWTLIEEDSSWGKQEQLRVLYEWETQGGLQDATNSYDSGKSSKVVDGSTIQPFPEQGWSSVKRKFSPAPTLTWCRPRHGTPVLVVPPPHTTSKNTGKKSGQKTGSTKKESAVSKRHSSGRMHPTRQQTLQVTLPQARFEETMSVPFNHDDEALLDSLAGVQLSPAPTINFQLENDNKSDESDIASLPPPPIRDVTIPTTTALERMWDTDILEGIAAEAQVEQMPAKKSFEGYEI